MRNGHAIASVLLPAVALAILAAAAEFDGNWVGDAIVQQQRGCTIDSTVEGRLRGGELRGQVQSPFGTRRFAWKVSPEGKVSGEGFDGSITGAKLSGTWTLVGRGGQQCIYRVTMTKQ